MSGEPATPDPWAELRRYTPARIALGRAGSGLPTAEVLRFALAHAQARDAVRAELDAERLAAEIRDLGLAAAIVDSAAPDRTTYLARPDLGRRLGEAGRTALAELRAEPADLAVVIGDGLSAPAAQAHAAPLLAALTPWFAAAGFGLGPVVIVRQARVAAGDEVGAILGARAVLVLIGERPGLSAPDSLGAYLTVGPRIGRNDGERNCLSNIRPAGLSYDLAAFRLAWLVGEALRRDLTGVALKDESDRLVVGGAIPTPLLPGRSA